MLVFNCQGSGKRVFDEGDYLPPHMYRNENRVLNTPKRENFLFFLKFSIFSFEPTFENALFF